ncbi:hypothetical protein LTR97_000047 [Elasticomyces elasticus]|uniref:Uncharacterized protein n=1 Tax=Elasticomyces elasticus TaxID=574655 RepID=A0AAN7WCC5_9PEZI|nr:hypothetical protein LTR97_000047 [Elasticomyces elasticus]
MASSARLSEQPSDVLVPYTQARRETSADMSESDTDEDKQLQVSQAIQSAARSVRACAEQQNLPSDLTDSISRMAGFMESGVTSSNKAAIEEQMAQFTEMVKQKVEEGGVDSTLEGQTLAMVISCIAFVGMIMCTYLKEEEEEEERTRIQQRERTLRLKAQQSFRQRLASKECSVLRQNQQATSDFDAAVTSAEWREADGKHTAKMRERPSDFVPAYFQENQWQVHRKKDRVRRRVTIQNERHDYGVLFRDDIWLDRVLADLNPVTPTDPAAFNPVMETVRLPDGVRAGFKGNTGEAILELMQRTGSHLQILPFRHDSGIALPGMNIAVNFPYATGFQSLSLWGTPAQNAAAIDLLPTLVDAVTLGDSAASQNIKDYTYTTEATNKLGSLVVPPARGREDGIEGVDAAYWREQDARANAVETSEDELGVTAEDVDSDEKTAPIRAYWLYTPPSLEAIIRQRKENAGEDASSFYPLANWTTVTFTDHIETLTTLPPRLVRRDMEHGTHVPGMPLTNIYKQQVTNELLNCFSHASASSCISSEAVNLALSFFVKHSDYPAIRELLARLQEDNRYALKTDNFDVLLAAAAANEDVHSFRLELLDMLRRGLAPSSRTWVSLHRLVRRRQTGTQASRRVLGVMQSKGMFGNLDVLREVVKDIVELDLTAYLNNGRKGEIATLDAFVKSYDDLFRPTHGLHAARRSSSENFRPWLTNTTANIMAKVLLALGRTEDALSVVRMLEDCGEAPKVDTLNTFLTAAGRARDTSFIISILKRFEPSIAGPKNTARKAIQLDKLSYALMLQAAWGQHFFNMLRVIWRYACCAGEVDFEWQKRMTSSLLVYVPGRNQTQREGERLANEVASLLSDFKAKRRTPTNEVAEDRQQSRGGLWFGWAGKFAVGVANGRIDRPSEDTYAATVLSLAAQPRSEIITRASDHERGAPASPHHDRKARLNALLKDDIDFSARFYQPTIPLVEMLEQAWEMDMAWKAKGLGTLNNDMRQVADHDAMEVYTKMFGKMLDKGIEVPVRKAIGS